VPRIGHLELAIIDRTFPNEKNNRAAPGASIGWERAGIGWGRADICWGGLKYAGRGLVQARRGLI